MLNISGQDSFCSWKEQTIQTYSTRTFPRTVSRSRKDSRYLQWSLPVSAATPCAYTQACHRHLVVLPRPSSLSIARKEDLEKIHRSSIQAIWHKPGFFGSGRTRIIEQRRDQPHVRYSKYSIETRDKYSRRILSSTPVVHQIISNT